MNGNQMILSEFITLVPNIPSMIKDAMQDLLCKITVPPGDSAKDNMSTPLPKHP